MPAKTEVRWGWLLLLVAQLFRSQAEPLDRWTWRNPFITGARVHAVGASPEQFVAVGEGGEVLVSANGRDWREGNVGAPASLRGVAHGNGLWVAVGEFGAIYTSQDGLNWAARSTPYFFDLNAVTYGAGRFVAVGEATTVLTSPDGIDWMRQAWGEDPLLGITWGGGRFVAVGGEPATLDPVWQRPTAIGRPLFMSSPDGMNWSSHPVEVLGQILAVGFGNGRFVAVTSQMQLVSSVDGCDWQEGQFWSFLQSLRRQAAFCHYAGRFQVSFIDATYNSAGLGITRDGLSWDHGALAVGETARPGHVEALAANPLGLVAVGSDERQTPAVELAFTADGETWHRSSRHERARMGQFQRPFLSCGYVGEFYFCVPGFPGWIEDGFQQAWSSPDAQSWQPLELPDDQFAGLPVFGVSRYVAPTRSGAAMAVSLNGRDWTVSQHGHDRLVSRVSFADGRFFATGDNGLLLVSTNAEAWSELRTPAQETLGTVVFHDGRFVASLFATNRVLVSSDGLAWRSVVLSDVPALRGGYYFQDARQLVAWSEGFSAMVEGVGMLASTDGETWNFAGPVGVVSGYLAATPEQLLLSGYRAGELWSRMAGSPQWQRHAPPVRQSFDLPFSDYLAAVTPGPKGVLLTLNDGRMLQSDPLVETAPLITATPAALASTEHSWMVLRAGVLGTGPLAYQWHRDGIPLSGATAATLTLPAGEALAASYTVAVSNVFGMATSAAAVVRLAKPLRLKLGADFHLELTGEAGAGYVVEASYRDFFPVFYEQHRVWLPASGSPLRWSVLDSEFYPHGDWLFWRVRSLIP